MSAVQRISEQTRYLWKRVRYGLSKTPTLLRRFGSFCADLGAFLWEFLKAKALLVGLLVTAGLLILLFFLGLSATDPSPTGKEVALSQAQSLIAAGSVQSATLLDEDSNMEFTTNDGQQLWASYPGSDSYTGTLLDQLNCAPAAKKDGVCQAPVPTTVDSQAGIAMLRAVIQFLIPILILVTLFAFFMMLSRDKGAGAFAGFSKFTGKSQKAGTGRFTFKDVAGAPEALVELREICDYLENPLRYAELGAAAPKGILLTGPPGTGKTLLARAVAGEAAANFFSLSGSEFVESLVGVGAARVRDLFRQARKAAPAIIFIDEIDAVGRQRGAGMGQGHDEREQTLNQMLVEMDGFGAESGVVVMAATNRPDILDNALLRPGRFDRTVVVDLPDVHGRTEILKLHASKTPMSADADYERIAHQTPGMSGADLANVINEASLLAVRAGKRRVEQVELEEAIDRVLAGPQRKSHLLSRDELWRIAVHECGHAIVARAIGNQAALQKLSVVARGRGRGGATIYASDDKMMLSHLDLARNLVTSMAGAAAEDYVFGMLSTGVEDDIREATEMAHAMVASYGMSPAIGPVAIGQKQGAVFVGRDIANMSSVAAATLELVDAEVRRLVREAEETARRILDENSALLEDLGNTLIEAETLTGPSLEVFLTAVEPYSSTLVEPSNSSSPVVMRPSRADRDDAGAPSPN